MIASQLAHMLMVLTDTLMMARLSPEALAGGGLGAASYSFVAIFCIGVIAAVGTLVARFFSRVLTPMTFCGLTL